MEAHEAALVEKLIPENPELKLLVEEHQAFKIRLEDLNRRPYLAPEEDLERKKIQKAKLAVKDKIQHILNQHQV
jgi:uncharacterized protein YdcH (DUF465 family)